MFSEITKTIVKRAWRGWILYDGDCTLCAGMARRLEEILARRGFCFAPLQAPWVRERLGLSPDDPLEEMLVLTAGGRVLAGADAVLYLARSVWWAWPLGAAGMLPGLRGLARRGYRWIAARRHCALTSGAPGSCTLPASAAGPAWPGWPPLIAMPLLALLLRPALPPWGFMWAMAFAIFAGCKWLTWWSARERLRRRGARAGAARSLGYLLAWPGMDAEEFLNPERRPPAPPAAEWILALSKTLLGAALIWGAVRLACPRLPLLAGWIGMAGLVFLLHFGSFHLISLLWRRAGIEAAPIMRNPAAASSPGDFWGGRWNLGFRRLAHDLVFRPLAGRIGAAGAGLGAFIVSGLIHELVISLPAGAGGGLPSLYFIIQGLAVTAERSAAGRRCGLDRGAAGRLFALAAAAGPAFWLFHPPFVERVMLPFLKALGAT